MTQDKRFSIKIMGEVFESDEEGFLDLNDIWRSCGLDRKKRPSEWRNRDSKYFRHTALAFRGIYVV